MIYKNQYWYDIIQSNRKEKGRPIVGKWLYYDDTKKIHDLLEDLNTLVESGDIQAAKIARKLPEFDPYPEEPCVLCVFTSDDQNEKEMVKDILKKNFDILVTIWKIDWKEEGLLRRLQVMQAPCMTEDTVLEFIEKAAKNKYIELDLSDNQLTSLPPEIGKLTNLTTLKLHQNQLTSLPPEIGKLTNLIDLNLHANQLTSLPPEIGKLTNLIDLNLGTNQLTSLPPEIGKLTNLTTLKLHQNQLTSLPPEIGKLTNLIDINLGTNQLTSLPSEFWMLTNLIDLNLYANQLTSLPPEIGKLTNLININLGSNQLTSLPSEFWMLTNLNELHLSANPLTSLPREIGKLTNLTKLYLYATLLISLPPEIGKLANLNELNVYGNRKLISPPPEIVKHGINAIFEYLNQLLKEAIGRNEAKLILVGPGDVGKTTLAKRLIYNKFIEDKTTQGIDILRWRIIAPTTDQEEIKLNVWDFGGQEIYHATHQFFLTKRSIYLLVWNARKSRDYDNIYYWLHTIEAFGGDSPIILVMSKLSERNDDLNMRDLKEKFPQIVDLCKVDSKDGTGVPVLKDIIRQVAWQHLPQMRIPWPGYWSKVRERLEQNGHNWIEYSEFHQICESEALDKKQIDIDILDEYLHDLGVIIHFRDPLELYNMVILKPDWATKAFYKVLDMRSVRDRGGILFHSELEQIWDTNIYQKTIFSKLLEMMNKFELVYELDKRSHLVAELLPSTEPDFVWDDTNNLFFYYKYDFIPAGLITRFIVRVHQDLEEKTDGTHLCWREGAVLLRENTRAFVNIKPVERRIEIKINGDKKKELLAIIRHEFDYINSSIQKVNITKEIPCNCSRNCPHRFNYEDLLMAEKRGDIEKVDCPKSWNKVSLSLLLDGYDRKGNRMKEIDEISKEKGIPKIEVNPRIEVNPLIKVGAHAEAEASAKAKANVNIKVDLPAIQSDFAELKDLLIKANPNLETDLKETCDSLDEVSPDTEKEKFNKPFNKLNRFLKKLADENSDLNKIVSGTKKGIELAQKVGRTYNKFAQWLTLPQVPDLFLGNRS